MRDVFEEAKASYTIPQLWRMLELPGEPSASCCSPFREDNNPSFSIYDEDRKWKDFATDDGGDAVEFVRIALDADYAEVRLWFMERLGLDHEPGHGPQEPRRHQDTQSAGQRSKPKLDLEIEDGDESDWKRLADLRGLSQESIWLARRAGVLGFMNWEGRRLFVVTDDERRAAEGRRLDGHPYAIFGGKPLKQAPLSGVDKSWLPGAELLRGAGPETSVLVCEGATDLLTGYDLYTRYRKQTGGTNSWAPIAVLGGSCKALHPDCEPLLSGRRVRIVPDGDDAGRKMAAHWAPLLSDKGCAVDVVELPEGRDLSDVAGELEPSELYSCN